MAAPLIFHDLLRKKVKVQKSARGQSLTEIAYM